MSSGQVSGEPVERFIELMVSVQVADAKRPSGQQTKNVKPTKPFLERLTKVRK